MKSNKELAVLAAAMALSNDVIKTNTDMMYDQNIYIRPPDPHKKHRYNWAAKQKAKAIEVKKRRAKNKMAKASRKRNR